jgi:hypothetical protein
MLEVVIIVIVLCLLFVVGGILGWILKGLGVILSFLGQGCGYLIWKIIVIGFIIMVLFAMF